MAKLYEGMFLLDNQVVRENWKNAKGLVTGTLEKHGAKVQSARRWDERKLAYPIGGKMRATYVLAYFEMDPAPIPAMRRDFELNEKVLRYLMLSVPALPEGELDKARAEDAADFVVPAPPPDDAPEPVATFTPRRREDGEEFEIVVPDLENLGDEGGGERARPRRPEPKAAPASAPAPVTES